MKKILAIIVAIFIAKSIYSQKLKENKTDEFTGAKIKSTSWEWLHMKFDNTSKIRVRVVDSMCFLEVKYSEVGMGVLASSNTDPIMLKTNDSTIKLYPKEFKISCIGCGSTGFGGSAAMGFGQEYIITKSDFNYLLENNVIKFRIYFSDRYIEKDLESEKKGLISNLLKLVK